MGKFWSGVLVISIIFYFLKRLIDLIQIWQNVDVCYLGHLKYFIIFKVLQVSKEEKDYQVMSSY